MDQPAGVVTGTLTLVRTDGMGGGEWWQCSRHQLGSRVRFWEKIWIGRDSNLKLVNERQTDDQWGDETADTWIRTQVQTRARAGFQLHQQEGVPGPLTDLLQPGHDKRTFK